MLHVLLLLSVARSFLECLDDKGCGSRHDSDCAHSVDDHHFDLNLNSAPVRGSLLDVFTDFLGWHTEGTTLGSKGSSTCYFTSDHFQVD